MPTLFIPPMMRNLADGAKSLQSNGATLREVMANVGEKYPALRDAIVGDGEVRPGLAIAINGVTQPLGLLASVPEDAEIHILPAISGGGPCPRSDTASRARDQIRRAVPAIR